MHTRPLLTTTALIATVLLWTLGVHAQVKPAAQAKAATSPAALAPADAAVYLEVRDLATLREQFDADPLTALLREYLPINRQPKEWAQVQAIMGMRGPELIDRYLGETAALVLEAPRDGAPGAVITRVDPADARFMSKALELHPAGNVGDIELQQTRDAKLQTAFHNSWLALTGGEHKAYLRNLLQAAEKGDTLANSAAFNNWVSQLPDDRHVTLFLRPDKGGTHAASLRRDEAGMAMHYVADIPPMANRDFTIANKGAVSWGPLPATTVAAMTLNVDTDRQMPANPLLDRLVMPKSFATDVRPKMSAPTVVFLGEVPGQQIDPAVDFHVPVLGIAIHMKDPSVAADLDLMFDRLMLWANVSTANWGVSQIELEKRDGYQVAHVGKPLSERTGRDELKPFRMTAGAIGDWYVICTQDQFFQACQAAANGEAATFTSVVDSQKPGNLPAGNVMAAMHINAQRLSTHLGTWVKHWEKTDPALFSDGAPPSTAPRRWREEAKLAQLTKLISQVAAYYTAVDMQAVRKGDTEVEAGVAMQRKR